MTVPLALALIERIEQELPGVEKQVLAFAVRKVRAKRWTRRTGVGMPEGKEAADPVQEALARVLAGDRPWDPSKVALEPFLKGVVRSLVSAELEGEENKVASLADDWEGPALPDGSARMATPEQVVLDAERCSAIADEVLKAAEGDEVLEKIVCELLDGVHCSEAKEIAEATGLDVKQVYAGTRKLQRRLDAAARRRKP
jgi:DNA-directed RNA polymerase specialized sigma24 family protein